MRGCGDAGAGARRAARTALLMCGSRWLCQRSRHCLPVRPTMLYCSVGDWQGFGERGHGWRGPHKELVGTSLVIWSLMMDQLLMPKRATKARIASSSSWDHTRLSKEGKARQGKATQCNAMGTQTAGIVRVEGVLNNVRFVTVMWYLSALSSSRLRPGAASDTHMESRDMAADTAQFGRVDQNAETVTVFSGSLRHNELLYSNQRWYDRPTVSKGREEGDVQRLLFFQEKPFRFFKMAVFNETFDLTAFDCNKSEIQNPHFLLFSKGVGYEPYVRARIQFCIQAFTFHDSGATRVSQSIETPAPKKCTIARGSS